MTSRSVDRRGFLTQLGASAIALGIPSMASALGRTPLGGRITLHVPWSLKAIDPHDLRDPAAALFGAAIFDPLFGLDSTGIPYAALATAIPTREALGTVVRLREGLRTARLVPLDARDLIASVERARARGAGALLADIPRPTTYRGDAMAAVFGSADPHRLARALACPLTALVPRSFSSSSPDATGAFRAELSRGRLVLTRNLQAARGHSFLDRVEVTSAPDLKTSLRSFEAERDDLGWLGLGLHSPRRGAVHFDLGRAAWVVLATGRDAGAFGVPGIAQRLADALPPERLLHLGLGPMPAAQGDPAWGGPPAELLVDESSPHLVEIATALAPILSRRDHEVTVAPVSRAELARRRTKGSAMLALDVVRPLGSSSLSTLLALATADDPARAREIALHPPRLAAGASARSLCSTLRVGVIGEVRVTGGVVPDLVLARGADGWDLGASFRKLRK
jgi:peptide/nickel transport system substrate-binding protein